MGKNIIINVERREKDGTWGDGSLFFLADRMAIRFQKISPYSARNYELFSILEGGPLRYDEEKEEYIGECIPQRNRLPKDVSITTKDNYDCYRLEEQGMPIGPNPNYLTFFELLYLNEKNKGIREWDMNIRPLLEYVRVSLQAYQWAMDIYDTMELAQNLRFIYWFV